MSNLFKVTFLVNHVQDLFIGLEAHNFFLKSKTINTRPYD